MKKKAPKRQKDIIDWIYNEKKALLVTGVSQIGKTYLNNVLNNKDYGIKNAFVFSNFNVEVNGNVIYYPIYFIIFLEEQSFKLPKINKIDLSDL